MKILILLSTLLALKAEASNSYNKLHQRINAIVSSSKNLSRFTLGQNDQGDDLHGYVYSSNSSEIKVNHLVVAVHHGNEVLSADLVYEFIKSLSNTNGKAFKNKRVFIIPVLNRSGFNKEEREEVAKGISFDPNRDYPDPCIKKKDFNLKSTSLLANFVQDKNIIGAVTVHGYYGSLTYPWGTYTDDYRSIDHDKFKLKAKEAVRHNSYTTGTHADILYPAGGAFEDWAYFKYGVWSLLVELENRPNFDNDVKMLYSSIASFPNERSTDHRHLGNCSQQKDFGISRP